MTTYSVLQREDDVVLVPEGFSLSAFLFTGLWALWHRLWIMALLAAVVMAAAAMLPERVGFGAEFTGLLPIALALLFGFEANGLRRWALLRAGYAEAALVTGASLQEAELRYFASRPLAQHIAPARSPIRYGPDTLGLFGNV